MKEQYRNLEMEVIRFSEKDVIVTSGGPGHEGEGDDDF